MKCLLVEMQDKEVTHILGMSELNGTRFHYIIQKDARFKAWLVHF